MKTRCMQRFDRNQDFVVVKPFKFNGKPLQAGFQFHLKKVRFPITPAKVRALFESGFLRHPEQSVVLPSPYLMTLPDGSQQHLAELSYKDLQAFVKSLCLKVNKNKQDMQRQVCVHFSLGFPIPEPEPEVDTDDSEEGTEDDNETGDNASGDDADGSSTADAPPADEKAKSELEGKSENGTITHERDSVGVEDGTGDQVGNC
jgi:hypothetical protein